MKKGILSCFEQNLIDKRYGHWPKCEKLRNFLPLRFYVKSNFNDFKTSRKKMTLKKAEMYKIQYSTLLKL